MASRQLPNLGLKGFWSLGEDNYKGDMDLNLLTLSALVQGGVLGKVAALPGSPSDGDVYVLDETAGADANKIAIRDAGAWVMVVPQEGWELYDRADNNFIVFNGTLWSTLNVALPNPTGNGGKYLTVKLDETGYELSDLPGTGGEYATDTRWRILMTAAGSDATNAGFGEVEFLDIYGEQIFTSVTLTNSSAATGFAATNLIDANYSAGNGWKIDTATDTPVGSWVEFTFVSPITPAGLLIYPINGDFASAPEGFKVQCYDDGTSAWVDAGTFAPTWPDGTQQYFALTPVVPGSPAVTTEEQVRDIIAAMLTEGANINLTYDDDGNILTIASTVGPTPYNLPFGFSDTPVANEVLLIHVFTDPVTFADNFAGAYGYVGVNPAASFALTVNKNGSPVGTITVSTAGVFSSATTGTTVDFVAGDVMTITGPGSADTAIKNLGYTFKGTRS